MVTVRQLANTHNSYLGPPLFPRVVRHLLCVIDNNTWDIIYDPLTGSYRMALNTPSHEQLTCFWPLLITNQVPHLLEVHLPLPLHPSYFLPYRSHRGSLSYTPVTHHYVMGSLVQPNLTTGNPHVSY